MQTVRLTAAQALVRFLAAQMTEVDGVKLPIFAGVWAIFGHGNVAAIGEALYGERERLPTWRGNNEQAMAHAAIAFAKASPPPPHDGVHLLDRPRRHQHGDRRGRGPCQPAAGALRPRRRLRQPHSRSGPAAGRGFRRRHGFGQ